MKLYIMFDVPDEDVYERRDGGIQFHHSRLVWPTMDEMIVVHDEAILWREDRINKESE
jgi:hypothetical protein